MITKFQVAYKNLLRKRVRSSLTIIGIALSAWVLVSLLGFNQGYENSLNKDIDNMGFQLMIMAKGCPYEAATLMLKGGTGLRYMDESIMQDILKEPEVDSITPILMSAVFDPNKRESGGIAAYFGVDAKSFAAMKPFLKFRQGKWFSDENSHEAVMGFEAAELEQREVGDMILMPEKNVQFKVVGILERTGTQDDGTIFVPIKPLQKILIGLPKLPLSASSLKRVFDSTRLETQLYKLPDVQVVSLAQVKDTIMKLISTAKIMVLSHSHHCYSHRCCRCNKYDPDIGMGEVPGNRHFEDYRRHALGYIPTDLDRDPHALLFGRRTRSNFCAGALQTDGYSGAPCFCLLPRGAVSCRLT